MMSSDESASYRSFRGGGSAVGGWRMGPEDDRGGRRLLTVCGGRNPVA
jgi:hypothetical protein